MSMGSFLQHFDVAADDEDVPPRPRFYESADIYTAARTGDLARVELLVEQEGVDINRRDFWDSVPLYYACLCGHVAVVKYLLAQGAVCSENTFDGDRCLYGALTVEIRDLLLEADVKRAPPLKPLAKALKQLCALCDDPEQSVGVSHAFKSTCDLELMVGRVVYRVHKVIMAARLARFDEILSSQPISDEIQRISLLEGATPLPVVEALLVYVYSEKVELDMRDVEHLRRVAKHYGNPALVKMSEKELVSIKYYFKSIKRDTAPRKFILYPYSFPDEASLEHDMRAIYDRSRILDDWMSAAVHDLSEICVRNDYADAVLKVGEIRLRVHMCVLCARSDFFHQLIFSAGHGFEALPREICPLFGQSLTLLSMTDVSVTSLKLMMEYVYTDSFASLSEMQLLDLNLLSELFELSERFLIFAAKRQLGERLKKIEVTFFQILQLLMLADFYDVPNLREACLERIARELDALLDETRPSKLLPCFKAFVADVAPVEFTDSESLFDSSATKGDFHGVLSATNVSGIGSNTILEDLREKYLEIYGWEGEERDDHARDFDRRFFQFAQRTCQSRQRPSP